MKFSKSYMETLASPSFPQEWREGAIEYKQLKKLINGVVAELESLGLGADVLRELINSTDDGDESKEISGSDQDDGKDPIEDLDDEKEELGSSASVTRSASFQRRRPTVPRSTTRDSSVGSSAEDCEECAKDLERHIATQHAEHQHHHNNVEGERSTDSPAAEWVAHIAHAKHSRRRRSHRRSSVKNSTEEAVASASSGQEQANKQHEHDHHHHHHKHHVEYLVPPWHPDDQKASKSADEAFLNASHEKHGSAKMGKKDLEEFRRRNSSIDGTNAQRVRASSATLVPDRVHDWGGQSWRERAKMQPSKPVKNGAKLAGHGKGKWVQGKDGRRARAAYELGGTSEKPIPRIRLYVESPVHSDDELIDGAEADTEGGAAGDEDDEESSSSCESEGQSDDGKEDDGRIVELGSPSSRASVGEIKPLQGSPRSPIIRPGNDTGKKKRMRTREIVIPLSADTEFLDTLTGALSNLTTLQEAQRAEFEKHTEAVCNIVSQVASPYGNKHDLYAWREIFALWCELQIFESQREKDRGELSVDETEARLKKFVEELAKRGWNTEAFAMELGNDAQEKGKGHHRFAKLSKWKKGDGAVLPMKDPRSKAALEEFMRLNMALLDVKKFQRVNVEAARKILKKHDKRTALTASSDLGAFVEQQERMRTTAASAVAGVGISSLVNIPEHAVVSRSGIVSSHGAATHPSLAALLPSSTSALLGASLPHILLSLMTTTLLPILPSIDDYSCAICTSVAWRPIKLDCGHLFCIRCLVKLQKQGKNDCPFCRAKNVVGSADERNLDNDTIKYLQDWFPKEIKSKEKEDEKDRYKEDMLELGLALEHEKCTIA